MDNTRRMTNEDFIYLLDKRVRLRQPKDGFRSSMDTVLAAAACPAKGGERVLDLGCGVGGAGLCVAARVPGIILCGVEIQDDQAELARQNATLNGFEDCTFIAADVRDFNRAPDGRNALFDHVVCNPPYNERGAHTPSPSRAKALAMGHEEASLTDWVDAAARALKSGGSLTMIHMAAQTDKIILAMDGRFGAAEIIPLWPHAGEAAKRVIVRAVKGRKSPAIIHPGITLHEADGAYSAAAEAVLRGMQGIGKKD